MGSFKFVLINFYTEGGIDAPSYQGYGYTVDVTFEPEIFLKLHAAEVGNIQILSAAVILKLFRAGFACGNLYLISADIEATARVVLLLELWEIGIDFPDTARFLMLLYKLGPFAVFYIVKVGFYGSAEIDKSLLTGILRYLVGEGIFLFSFGIEDFFCIREVTAVVVLPAARYYAEESFYILKASLYIAPWQRSSRHGLL